MVILAFMLTLLLTKLMLTATGFVTRLLSMLVWLGLVTVVIKGLVGD